MTDFRELTRGLFGRPGAPREEIARVQRELNVVFPPDLVDLLESYDAAEGYVVGGYLQFWSVREMAYLNRTAEIERSAPGLVVIATDAGGDGFGIDRTTGMLVLTPMIGMSTTKPEPIVKTLDHLLRWIASRYPEPQPSAAGPPPAACGLVITSSTRSSSAAVPPIPTTNCWSRSRSMRS